MQSIIKAKNLLINNSFTIFTKLMERGSFVNFKTAIKAVEIASKPDWFYPSKNEFPDENIIKKRDMPRIIVKHHKEYEPYEVIYNCATKTFNQNRSNDYKLSDAIAWTYLPTYRV